MLLAAAIDIPDFLVRLFIDLVAISLLSGVLFLRRHGRRDLLVIYAVFNVGVFTALTVIASHKITTGVGFGLFAVLSIIRLRSEPFDNIELSYFFASLVLALVNGFELQSPLVSVLLSAIVLVTVFLIDHRSLHATIRRRTVTLDAVHTDADALRAELAERLKLEIVELAITDIDYVRDTTRVVLRYVADPRVPDTGPGRDRDPDGDDD